MRAIVFACMTLCSASSFASPSDQTPFPLYDVEQACRRGGLEQTACVRYVQPFYDTLRAVWDQVDEPIKRECVARYQDNIHARYVQILSCIDAQMQKQDMARRAKNPDRFRY